MLRASGEFTGNRVDPRAVTDSDAASTSGIAHAGALLAFADAIVGEDDTALERARAELLRELGPEKLVDAAAVASNFERMVRIADSTGIPLDGPMEILSADLREELKLDRYGSARNTRPVGARQQILGRVLRPAFGGALRLLGAIGRRRGASADRQQPGRRS